MRSIDLKPGIWVMAGARRLELLSSKSASLLMARDIATGEVISIRAGEIDFEIDRRMAEPEPDYKASRKNTSLDGVNQSEIDLAVRRYDVLSPLIDKKLTKQEVQTAAERLGVSKSQIYRLIAQLDPESGFVSLIPQKRGRLKGEHIIAASAEDVISEIIRTKYRGKGATIQSVILEVRERCSELAIPVPSDSTISNRIKSHDPKILVQQTEGAEAASQLYDVRGGKILLSAPLQLVQIDHALVDCIIVDSDKRLPLCRPWATLAIDVFTRSMVGMHLSLAYPSSMSVALCISNGLLPKDWWLNRYGLEMIEYPFYGVPKRIHVDNAKEFRSQNLQNSCRLYNTSLTYRPRGKPYNGAHIERLIGTFMRKVHMLPGATMSSVEDRKNYDSEKHAALTFPEFREWFIREAEIYHKKEHSELGCSPLFKWEKHYTDSHGVVSHPPIVEDRLRLLIDFMPFKRRVIGRRGIRLNNLDYYSAALKRLNIRTRCKVRFDPESMSKIWILPDGEINYIELGYADVRLPDISLAEFRHARKQLSFESSRRVTPEQVFALIKRNEALVQSSIKQTKLARKHHERNKMRRTDRGHPLNGIKGDDKKMVSVDYSRKPRPFIVEE
ncbi:hypothetical protein BWR59_02755 [Pseudomonas sp. Bc-h]|uniref:integrase catalytic domain-containing protein n=1 Tax=Pseudomonas sp. Bc-h TaxID=1943632 RepID=UPI0009DA2687|nr:Mu transposase C-terminal domain-containing protein [Pseudomonas sp. Bc-h]OQR36614.1 hypothetical protein BWR59_02755 [Pseudomonas sp. Bc-h]